MVAMVNVCIGALLVMVSTSVVGSTSWVNRRLTCSLCTASSLSFSSSPTSVLLLWRAWISWKHECFFKKSPTHTNTGCVEECKYRLDPEDQAIFNISKFLHIFEWFIMLSFSPDPHRLCKHSFGSKRWHVESHLVFGPEQHLQLLHWLTQLLTSLPSSSRVPQLSLQLRHLEYTHTHTHTDLCFALCGQPVIAPDWKKKKKVRIISTLK